MSASNKKLRYSQYFYNPVSYCGALLTFIVFIIECFLFGMDFFSKGGNVYLGIITYIILPPFMVIGLLMIPIGAFRHKRRIDKGLDQEGPKDIHINLAVPAHRNALIVFIIGTTILLVMTAIGSYKAYTYTESVQFCGVTCHGVMIPQYTTYLHSPHSRVKCVECHIGEGPDWYVHYKLAGVRQLYHFLKNDYSKPIHTSVENLRSPVDTCLNCHSPDKFYGSKEYRRTYYSSQGDVPVWNLRMLMHVGGDGKQDKGIHAHMNIDHDIYYAKEDDQRQKITWIKSVAKDGTETVYTTEDSQFKDAPPAPEIIRKMDCLDCHNRPTHQFKAPYRLIDSALNQNQISLEIPNIKSKLMEVISAEYTSTENATEEITKTLTDYYQNEHAEFYAQHKKAVDKAIEEATLIYKKNFFPEMNTRWDKRPDNIGHLWSQGCFRCHDGMHRSDSGKEITRNCNACHTIIEQGVPGSIQSNISGLEFIHPFEDDGSWKETNCTDCHTGN